MRSCFTALNPNLQWAWDSTSLTDFKICPRRYQYSILEGHKPRSQSVHLRFGAEFHSAVEDYEHAIAIGLPHNNALQEVIWNLLLRTPDYPSDNKLSSEKASAQKKTKANLISMVIDYFDFYNPDPAKTHILENGNPAVEVSFNFDIRKDFLLCGHLDRIVRFNDDLFVLDHKTTTYQLTQWYFGRFDLDTQMSLYTLAGQIVVNSPVRGVIIDAIKVSDPGTSEFNRGLTYRDSARLDEWIGDLDYHIDNAKRYAEAGYWPMNETSCDKYGGCPYKSVCSQTPSVRPAFLEADFTQAPEDERWNPLTPRGATLTTPSIEEPSGSPILESAIAK